MSGKKRSESVCGLSSAWVSGVVDGNVAECLVDTAEIVSILPKSFRTVRVQLYNQHTNRRTSERLIKGPKLNMFGSTEVLCQ